MSRKTGLARLTHNAVCAGGGANAFFFVFVLSFLILAKFVFVTFLVEEILWFFSPAICCIFS